MAKITYLFGAGASIGSVPMVSEMESRLIIYKNYLIKYFSAKGIEDYINELKEIIENISESTIDGYARTLHQNETGDRRFNKLKGIIIGFFLFEQMKKKNLLFETDEIYRDVLPYFKMIPEEKVSKKIKNTLDQRYSTFFGKVLNDDKKLKAQINILSWNYDIQFEIAMERIGIGYKYLDSYVDIFPFPMLIDFNEFIASERVHNILKLNGTAGIFKKKEEIRSVYESQQDYFDDLIDTIMSIYKESCTRVDNYNPLFNFAWEKNKHSEYVLSRAKKMIKETEILVVIGYSFPDFNREIDREIFSIDARIKKVYLQVNNDLNVPLNMRGLNNNFNEILEIVPTSESFYIPPEL